MKFYRLDSTKRKTAAEAFSGKGGLYAEGRWNSLGNLTVYVSQSVALAYLERLAHMNSEDPEDKLHLFEIEVPDNLVEIIEVATLPAGRDVRPPGPASRKFGDEWLAKREFPALVLPSVIVGQESNAIINPLCPKFNLAWVKGPAMFPHDARLTPRIGKR